MNFVSFTIVMIVLLGLGALVFLALEQLQEWFYARRERREQLQQPPQPTNPPPPPEQR